MRKFAVGSAILTIVAGGVGYVLRHLYQTRAVEPDTGLPLFGSPSLLALVGYTIFVVVLAFLIALSVRRGFGVREHYREIIAPVNIFYRCCIAVVCVLLLASGAIGIFQAVTAAVINKTALIRAVFNVLTGVSIFGMTYEALGKIGYRASLVFSIIPELGLTFWLLMYYRSNQTNPVILNYVFLALALAASAFAFYFTAGLVFGRIAPLRFVFSHSAAVYFLLSTLADDLPLTDRLAFIAFAIFFTLNLSRFVLNMQPNKKKRPIAAKNEAPQTEAPQPEVLQPEVKVPSETGEPGVIEQ